VNSRLTLNLGVRWDLFTPFTEEYRISNLNLTTGKIDIAGQNGVSKSAGVRTSYTNFAPCIGFAYMVSRNTVLRTRPRHVGQLALHGDAR
jgi:outer membrane receptor protein involved in Fe transport